MKMFVFGVVSAAKATNKVQGGFEPPSLDSKSRVLTVTPLDHAGCIKLQLEDSKPFWIGSLSKVVYP